MGKKRKSKSEEIFDVAAGQINEAAGVMSGDKSLEAEGRADQRKSQRKTYSVRSQPDGRWRVEADDSDRASSVHDMKDDAVRKAKELAQNQKPSQVLIYKQNDTVQSEQTYS